MVEKENEPKPIFKKPYGRYEGVHHDFFPEATDGPILCEACGTLHQKDKAGGYRWAVIFGRQLVSKCCGRFVEEIYEQFGPAFTDAFLDEFADDPTDSKFASLRRCLPEVIETANRKIAEFKLNATLELAAKSKD